MDIYSILTLLGGFAFFMFGMNLMSGSLEKMWGGKLESLLKKTRSNKLRGLLLGGAITMALQSSSAVTVMLVGLVNSGVMNLGQSSTIVMGSNIGTTVTAWILALSGTQSDLPFLHILRPELFYAMPAVLGMLIVTLTKSDRRKTIGSTLIGFSIIMTGMNMMTGSIEPLSHSTLFLKVLGILNNPFIAVLIGTAVTALVRSSVASVAGLQCLAANGMISFAMAIPTIMGQNIGTCIRAVILSRDANKNAKRVSLIHLLFNLIGTIVFLTVYCLSNHFMTSSFENMPITLFEIALAHTIFNVATTIILFPFSKQLENLAGLIVKDKSNNKEIEESYSFIDLRLLSTPSVAIRECNSKCKQMAKLTKEMIFASFSLITKYEEPTAKELAKNEDILDMYEDKLGSFLFKLATKEISETDSQSVSRQLHTIVDLERIGDHAMNILGLAQELHSKKIRFSETAKDETDILISALTEIINTTVEAYVSNNIALAKHIEPLEEAIDQLINDIKTQHIERLKSGECSIELGFILSDLLTNCERVSDHCSNIAIAIIETPQLSFDAHEYINDIKNGPNSDFQSEYDMFKAKYSISE